MLLVSHALKMRLFFVLALLCLLLLFLGGPGYDAPRSYRIGWDLGHLFCFGLWSYLYLRWRPCQGFFRQLAAVVLLALVVGGATELLQLWVGREASWEDLAKDLLGCLVAVVFTAPSRFELLHWQRLFCQAVVAGWLLWSVLPFGRVVADELIAAQQFPLLSGFETPFEASRWSGNSGRKIERSTVFSGTAALRLRLNTDRYSGAYQYYSLGDWSNYQFLQLQAYNPDPEPLQIHLRIHDQDHRKHQNAYRDRFSARFNLQQGWNRLEVPLDKVVNAPKGRQMDLRRVAGLGLFVAKLAQPRTIYIDEVRLLP